MEPDGIAAAGRNACYALDVISSSANDANGKANSRCLFEGDVKLMVKKTLYLTSLMSDNEGPMFEAWAHYIEEQTGISVSTVDRIRWKEREQLLDAGGIDIAWICGLPYVLRADEPDPGIELLAAPVMAGKRYENQPIYFSDVVVHKDSSFNKFTDLKGASWAYNEPYSHSGYNVVRHHLFEMGQTGIYFGRVVESGSHLVSLQMILRHEVDASAIDSIVLEIELRHNPAIRSELKIIESLGPSPIPPLVISRKLPLETREMLRDVLIRMDANPSGREALVGMQVSRFTPITDSDYDIIRHMYRKSKDVRLQPSPINKFAP